MINKLIGKEVLSSDTKFHPQSVGYIHAVDEDSEYSIYVEWNDGKHKDGWYRKSALIIKDKEE